MTAPSLRILFLIDEMKALTDGGTERQVLQMVRLLAAEGAAVQICTLRGTKWLTPELAGCSVHSAEVASLFSPRGLLRLWRLSRWIRAQGFDVVQTFFVDANICGPFVAKLAGVRTILGSRRNLNYWMGPAHRLLQRMANALTTRLVANCEAVRRATAQSEGMAESRIDVIYNGIDTRHFSPDREQREGARRRLGFSADDLVVGMVAVLRPIKGCEAFIDAASLVAPRAPRARFVLVGDGPLRGALQERAVPLGQAFSFAGSVEDVRSILAALDVAVLSSESEGFSNSVLEYLAMGLPAVVTDVGGNAEAVGEVGVVVPPAQPARLAEELVALLADEGRRQSLGASARQRALTFSLEGLGSRIKGYYLRLVTQRS